MSQETPAQLVAIAAVGRIGEEPFLKVSSQKVEEVALRRNVEVGKVSAFEAGERGVLLFASSIGEGRAVEPVSGAIQGRQAEPVALGIVPVRAGQSPIHVFEDPDRGRAGAVFAGGEKALEEGRGRARFVRVQDQQG